MEKLILTIFTLYLFYCILPTIYYKWFNTKVVKHLDDTNNIALTFDDGIDKVYTEKLLDLLYKYNIKATFFILAKSIDENPMIVKRMVDEGHIVGLHSLEHKNALLKGYFYTKKDFQTSMKILEKNDLNIKFFRPPWGHINIFSLMHIKKYKLKLILWNVMVGDWRKHTSSKDIETSLIRKVKNGCIIRLHDGRGRDDAPKRTIEALESTIPQLKEKGFNFVTMEYIYE